MDLTTLDGETFARRRDRRVSFAETTAVHLFDRDDSLGSPRESESSLALSPCSDSGENSSRDTREDDDEDEDDDGDGDEEMAVPPVRFTRNMTDSSPGSASVASVASNDDENFFGPVSRSFMKSGGVSDSGVSEDNNNVTHDITLDSTAFSLHYRNIGRDDRSANSASSLLTTPTDIKTPFVKADANEMSRDNNMVSRLKFSASMLSAGLGDSSFAATDSSKYNFGNFSASLNDLLRQVDETLKPAAPVSHPISAFMDNKGDSGKLLTGELSQPTDASMHQNGDGAKPTGENPHRVDVSIDNGSSAKILPEETSYLNNVSIDKNSDGFKPISGQDPHPIDYNGDNAKPLPGEVFCPLDVSTDKNADDATPFTEQVSHPIVKNDDGAKLPPEVSHPNDVSMDQDGDDAWVLTGGVPCQIDSSIDQNGNAATLQTEISSPIDIAVDHNVDAATPLTVKVSHPIDVSVVQNGDGAKLLKGEYHYSIDVSIDNNSDDAKVVSGEVSNAIDVLMEENVNCDELLLLGIHASDDKPAYEKDEVSSLRFPFFSCTICDN